MSEKDLDVSAKEASSIDYKTIATESLTVQVAFGERAVIEPRNIFRQAVAIENKQIHPIYSSWTDIQEAARNIDPEILDHHVDGLITAYREIGETVDPTEIKKLQDTLMDAYFKDYS